MVKNKCKRRILFCAWANFLAVLGSYSDYGPAKLRFFDLPEQYETEQFGEGYETQFSKRLVNSEV